MSQRPRLHRHYWEGIYSANFTLDRIQQRIHHLVDVLNAHHWSCLVAYDTRFMGRQFAHYVYDVLHISGVEAHFCPTPVPIPFVELALVDQRLADCAIVISAGNRPHWYNGITVLAPPVDEQLMPEQHVLDPPQSIFPFPPVSDMLGTEADLHTPYFDVVHSIIDIELIRRSTLTVFIDPMSGSTSGAIPALIGDSGQTKAIEINREMDPLFSRQIPHPAEAELNRLRKLVRDSDSHMGIALSADGRAIGVVDTNGERKSLLEVTLLLSQYLVRQYRQKGVVVIPQCADTAIDVDEWAQNLGITVEALADPSQRIIDLLNNDRNKLLAGVTPTGALTLGRYSDSPDAILAAMLLIEMTARSGGKLHTLLDDLHEKIGSA
ncbi:MAG: phosphoglucomutase [Chloroflexi bacterium AL-W]|nr:phosphoglucomutase [Chloroflexi bacterium AL-N1]NOK65119.1 phosphoglucomutase [Chloroflexi bacterium AL-N10]NOK72614.1 phosphoglucomutase [Chloroflexi bacterium AL-N5]NOK79298.1 phosphoglucomutase [Chloroflexi bacterium AL-W]NOK87214.1 phosphoglucomutase [Chloroflexi bacterium AL-N15]